MNETKHTHSFCVDTSCECGIMLSGYTRQLVADNTRLREALQNLCATVREVKHTNTVDFMFWLKDREEQARAALTEKVKP